MYVGHVGIALAFGAERDAPPLWLIVLAAQGPDWADALSDLVAGPPADPWWNFHGFVLLYAGAVVCACVAALLAARRDRPAARAATIVALAYLSHWVADYFTGIKPTWPGGPLVGLQWYAHPARDLALESVVVCAGWWLWQRAVSASANDAEAPRRVTPHPLAWALLAALLALQLAGDVMMGSGPHFG